jgi:hypothetical protein
MFVHLVARVRTDRLDLRMPAIGSRLWRLLRLTLPSVLSSIIMPSHLHWVGWVLEPEAARRSLAMICGRVQAALGWPARTWEPVPSPRLIESVGALRREMRYVGLNENRQQLASDPLEPVFSTHRDLVGAVVDPWPDARQIASWLRWPLENLGERIHQYVSADPSVDPLGTASPRPFQRAELPSLGLDLIARAAAAATRASPDAIRSRTPTRKLFVQLARHAGWSSTQVLARACEVTGKSIRLLSAEIDRVALAAGALCLGDERLVRRFGP